MRATFEMRLEAAFLIDYKESNMISEEDAQGGKMKK
jgi:hypothetical protein